LDPGESGHHRSQEALTEERNSGILFSLQRYTGFKCRLRRPKGMLTDPVMPNIVQELLKDNDASSWSSHGCLAAFVCPIPTKAVGSLVMKTPGIRVYVQVLNPVVFTWQIPSRYLARRSDPTSGVRQPNSELPSRHGPAS